MAWIRAMGGGNAKEEKTPIRYLVHNGVNNDFVVKTNGSESAYLAYGSDNMAFVTSNQAAWANIATIKTSEKIDLSKYDRLVVEMTYYADSGSANIQPALAISTSGKTTSLNGQIEEANYSWGISVTTEGTKQKFTFDISDADDSYYFILRSCFLYGNTTVNRIYNMYLVSSDNDKYLYKDGKQNVEWDNGLYKYASSYTIDGMCSFNESNISVNAPSGNAHCYTLVSNKAIDVTEFSKVKILYNSTNTIEVDVSSITGNVYVCISRNTTESGGQDLVCICSLSKDIFSSSSSAISYKSSMGTSITYINRIWLEK